MGDEEWDMASTAQQPQWCPPLDWLLDSDPAIRWQVLRDLTDSPADAVAAERARVATEGWGARLLAARDPDGQWMGGACFPGRGDRAGGRQPAVDVDTAGHDGALRARARPGHRHRARDDRRWSLRTAAGSTTASRFFDGEVEPCINGRTVTLGAYFGADVDGVVARLLADQLDDGGWNC